ncbi:glycerol kinase GlpK [Halalkalibacter alkaliphilus]|uniref:ATP:glycerol 3-phosphotransferase n=1 Tax=Halalkalibacter alkaliphilus TaxID=2917993 RepID=A0A9X2CX65_9BACI|nr:glycerol kinase GlpK [Halalkalibacter alkaliphilus]MCL7749914.1 glycerol kinase GlpK [Halalkalibacter alkaliphilus]
MSKDYILAIDQSTSGTKVKLVNKKGEIITKKVKEHQQYYPEAGWCEHDPIEIYQNVKSLLGELVESKGIDINTINVLSITNQRETIVVWDKTTGLPVYNAIVWQCRRTADDCKELKDQGFEQLVNEKTGLTLDPYFSATKVKWILDHVEGARAKAEKGELLLGTVDSWLIWKLTNGSVHATDYTNASRTLLFNIYDLTWDYELLEIFGIPFTMLPEVKFSNEIFGYTEDLTDLVLPISGIIGDSHGALLGQMCFEEGMIKATYGTGSSLMMNTGKKPIKSTEGLMTTIAYAFDGTVHYALEGIIHSTGDTLKWVKDNLGLFDSFEEAEKMAISIKDNDGVYIIPAFLGLGAPYWNPFIKASISGITRRTNKCHIVRAGMESIVYQIKDVIELMHNEAKIKLKELRVDGGPTKNEFLMQFQADILGLTVVKTNVAELSSMGAVYLAGIGTGFWDSIDVVRNLNYSQISYSTKMDETLSAKYYSEWQSTIHSIIESLPNKANHNLVTK